MNNTQDEKPGSLEGMVREYPVNTALLRLRKGDEVFEWAVAAVPQDDEASLRKHAERWMPFSEFIGVAFNRPTRSSRAAREKAPPEILTL